MSLNKVFLMGNLTRDPEIRHTPMGTAVAEFGIAVNKVWFNDAGEKQEAVTFVDITAWERGAEWAAKHLVKGANIHIEGELKLDQWDDKETGQKRSKLKVTAQKLTPCFATWKDGPKPEEGRPQRTQAPGRPAPQERARVPADPDLDPDEDSVPF